MPQINLNKNFSILICPTPELKRNKSSVEWEHSLQTRNCSNISERLPGLFTRGSVLGHGGLLCHVKCWGFFHRHTSVIKSQSQRTKITNDMFCKCGAGQDDERCQHTARIYGYWEMQLSTVIIQLKMFPERFFWFFQLLA